MNDSRVDRVANAIRDAQAEQDTAMKLRIVEDALTEWEAFADEYGSDVVVAVVTRRLSQTVRQLAAGLTGVSGLSLQVASNAVRAVQQR